jgi:hypothetical protein
MVGDDAVIDVESEPANSSPRTAFAWAEVNCPRARVRRDRP